MSIQDVPALQVSYVLVAVTCQVYSVVVSYFPEKLTFSVLEPFLCAEVTSVEVSS